MLVMSLSVIKELIVYGPILTLQQSFIFHGYDLLKRKKEVRLLIFFSVNMRYIGLVLEQIPPEERLLHQLLMIQLLYRTAKVLSKVFFLIHVWMEF